MSLEPYVATEFIQGYMDKVIKSANPQAEQIIEWGESHKIETCFDRAEKMKPCPIGVSGACCKVCHMGPCRFMGPNAEEDARGVCGATLPTVATRKLLSMAGAGAAAHSDHARDMARCFSGERRNKGLQDNGCKKTI
jgi:carbon-monoxide dehydrogenase catalytic subunit